MPLGAEQEELTKNIAQMVLEHGVGGGRSGIVGSAALNQITPMRQTCTWSWKLSEQSSVIMLFFFSLKGLLVYNMLSLSPLVTTGLSLKPMR